MAETVVQELIGKARTHISKKKFQDAVDTYTQVKELKITSPEVESYLGVGLVETGRVSEGLYHLGLGSYLGRGDQEYAHNLKFAQSKVENGYGTRLSHPAEFFISLETRVRSEELLFASFSMLFFFCCALILKNIRWLQKIRFWALSLSLLSVFLSFGTLAFTDSIAVASRKSELRDLPLITEPTRAFIPEGSRMKTLRFRGDFVEVERPGQFRGWILKSNLTIVPN
jgi:hypothetical protein